MNWEKFALDEEYRKHVAEFIGSAEGDIERVKNIWDWKVIRRYDTVRFRQLEVVGIDDNFEIVYDSSYITRDGEHLGKTVLFNPVTKTVILVRHACAPVNPRVIYIYKLKQ